MASVSNPSVMQRVSGANKWASQAPRPDLWDAYKLGLMVQNDRLNRDATGQPKDKKIDDLLSPDGPAVWTQLYEAEQRLAAHMSDDEIAAEAARRFLEADKLSVPSSKTLRDSFDKAATVERRREIFICLLDDLQFRYAKRSLDRKMRKSIAKMFNVTGALLILPVVVGMIFVLFRPKSLIFGECHFLVVVYFGMIGAFLSRTYAFQAADALDYDGLISSFPTWSLFVRLILGVMGAILMYLLIRAHLLGGNLFPTEALDALWTNDAYPLPSPDFAKLLIWSTIAGFSERLIPDQFTTLAAKGSSTLEKVDNKSP